MFVIRHSYLLFALVFFTGAAALGIEVVWSRMLQRLLGSTAWAVAAVLAGYLGGMGLGAHLGERFLGRMHRPLQGYAGCEWAAAACVLLVTVLLQSSALAAMPAGSFWILALVTAASVPIGASFPLLVAALPNGAQLESRLRHVYGWNALGGAVGGVLTGLVLVPAWGEWRTITVLVTVEAVVAAIAFVVYRRSERAEEDSDAATPQLASGGLALASYLFLSGFVVLYWEVLWTRILTLVVGGTAYAFAVVTGAVVLGIGVGSLTPTPRWLANHRPWILPLLVAGLVGWTYFAVPLLPEAYLFGVRSTGASPLVWGTLGAGAVVFLPSFLLGSLFPMLVSRWRQQAGNLYAVNSVGAVLGALVAGPILAGVLSLEAAYHVGLSALLALVLLGVCLRSTNSKRGSLLSAAAAVLLCVLGGAVAGFVLRQGVFGQAWDRARLLSGVYQWPLADLQDPSLSLDRRFAGREILSVAAGREVIVSVELDEPANTVYVKANGKVEGSLPVDPQRPSLADLPTQILLGELGAQLRLGASGGDSALLIGLGSGVTLSALAAGAGPESHPRTLDVIELERAFLSALRAPTARPYLEGFLPDWLLEEDDPEALVGPCRFHFGDARRLLGVELRERRWDVIVSQPSEPWLPGAAPLFTQEFFELVARRLKPGGVLVQWLQLYKVDLDALRILVRTVRQAFPQVYLLRPPATGGLLVLAASEPIDLVALLRAPPGMMPAATHVTAPLDRLTLFLGGTNAVDRWVGLDPKLPTNTDDRSIVLRLTRMLYAEDRARQNLLTLQREIGSDPILQYLPEGMRQDRELMLDLAWRNARVGDFWEALTTLQSDSSPEASVLAEEIRREMEHHIQSISAPNSESEPISPPDAESTPGSDSAPDSDPNTPSR